MMEWNRNELSLLFDNGRSGLVYFYTPMCGTCQMASKMLEIVEQLTKVAIGKMNLNFYPDLAQQWRVQSVPCLLFVKDGAVVEMIYAFHSVPFLLEKINSVLG